MSFPVPKMYKSSDRYNAGTDVIYNDESKLQYAPFIYATTQSGDNGADGGDEEGDETMLVKYNSVTRTCDKTWQEVKDALLAGKIVMLINDISNTDDDPYTEYSVYYLTKLVETDGEYYATFMGAYEQSIVGEAPGTKIEHTIPLKLKADSASDYLKKATIG